MATQAQAELAANLFSDQLVKGGAHGIGTESGAGHGHAGYVVVAYVQPSAKSKIPDTVTLPSEHGGASVPVVTKSSAPFSPQ